MHCDILPFAVVILDGSIEQELSGRTWSLQATEVLYTSIHALDFISLVSIVAGVGAGCVSSRLRNAIAQNHVWVERLYLLLSCLSATVRLLAIILGANYFCLSCVDPMFKLLLEVLVILSFGFLLPMLVKVSLGGHHVIGSKWTVS